MIYTFKNPVQSMQKLMTLITIRLFLPQFHTHQTTTITKYYMISFLFPVFLRGIHLAESVIPSFYRRPVFYSTDTTELV